MTAAKKKKGITLLILFLLMAVLIAAYFLLAKGNKEKEAKENAGDIEIMLSSVQSDDITRIDYSNEFGSVTLEKEDKWVNKESKEEADVSSILIEISEIRASQLVTENPDDLGDYGLDKPAITVNASLKDGSYVSIGLGDAVTGGAGYYACLTGEEKVYVVASSLYQCFSTAIE